MATTASVSSLSSSALPRAAFSSFFSGSPTISRASAIRLAASDPLAALADAAKPDPKMEFDPAHAEKMKEGLDLFKGKVRQILVKSCVECHGGPEVESGLDLATRKGLLRGGSKGPAVVA